MNNIYYLKDGFGLLEERGDENYFTSLIFLDLHKCSLQKLYTIKYPSRPIQIIVDKTDPTTFLLRDINNDGIQICKIVDNSIITGDVFEAKLFSRAFVDKCVYGLKSYYTNYKEVRLLLIRLIDVLDTSN